MSKPALAKAGDGAIRHPAGEIFLFPKSALATLARYAFRIAITNNRILVVDDATVTYRCKGSRRQPPAEGNRVRPRFIRRFLQHVLPAGFRKIRHYGLWHASRREPLRNLRNVLLPAQPASPPAEPAGPEPDADPQAPPPPRRCPHCEIGHPTPLRRLSPAGRKARDALHAANAHTSEPIPPFRRSVAASSALARRHHRIIANRRTGAV